MHLHGGHARSDELPRKLASTMLGACEHERLPRRRREVHDDVQAVPGIQLENVVRHFGNGGSLVVDPMNGWIRKIPTDEDVNCAVQGRGEEKSLPTGGREV